MTSSQLTSQAAAVRTKPISRASASRGQVRAVVIGAGGYSGAELVGLLASHPRVQVSGLYASGKSGAAGDQPQAFADLFPRWRGLVDMPVLPTDLRAIEADAADIVFLATPHEVSHDLTPALLEMQISGEASGGAVIDLSAAFRLKDASLYPKHYGFEHQHPHLLAEAVYGLPEINRQAIKSASLVAAPGCYPTSAILPIKPLVDAGAVAPGWRVIIDSTSGVSGAGRAPVLKSMFCEVSLQPYSLFSHRHAPEIATISGAPVLFTPHLGAFDRGILSTIHIKLAEGWSADRVATTFEAAYGDDPFVRLLSSGRLPSVAGVERTNFCDIGFGVDEAAGHLIVISALDNLIKGAAGQAVQCMNIRLGLPETAGLGKEAA